MVSNLNSISRIYNGGENLAEISNKEFVKLIREYKINMFRLAFGMLRNQADAEDAVSEAVLKAYENKKSLKKTEKFKPWIMQITANETKKIYNKAKRIQYVDNLEVFQAVYQDEHHELWDVITQLEDGYREIVILYFYEQMKIKDISKLLHIPEGTVKTRLFRAKKILKKML